ncbi:zinc finger protein [Danaus plexippus plexippus]|uniref:Zinc finger protein n=1 Tax=Danaus plexippus plexippus TaxID=278856 RepID=A0A212EQY0_DANPL|nr:zinc finger protein [Danaus plexippus plexippus]
MADEIEIEEHDVLENPRIKRIFPDLSILKKEIGDNDVYDGCDESSKSSIAENSMTTINDKNQGRCISESNEKGPKRQKLELHLKKPKVCLQNISISLNKNPNFCKTCSIVFPRTESYNEHRLYTHRLPINEDCDSVNKNFECNECNVTFVNYGNLSRHRRNIHSIHENRKYNDKTITGVNVMVKINDTNFNPLPESNLKECFHCDMLFKTQQSLIDHLYDVLDSRKTQSSQIKPVNESEGRGDHNKQPRKDIDQEQYKNIVEMTQHVMIFRCPICSYCFNEWEFYEAHMIKKHNVSKVKETSMVPYKPSCKFCNLQYSNYKSYNTHLHKRHKNKILQRVRKQSSNKINKAIVKKTLLELKRQDHIRHQVGQINDERRFDNVKALSEEQLSTIKTDVKVVAHQTILFRCSQCNIHFLTSAAAKDHTEHSSLDDSECTVCDRQFKIKDINIHMEQHKYSNYITVNTCKGRDTQEVLEILHKCPSCAVHFSKEGILKHYTVCKMSPSKSAYCKVCDILISEDIKTSHYEEHDKQRLKPSDCKIVEFKKLKRRNFKISNKRGKGGVPKYLFHLIQCNVCDCNILKAHYKSAIHFRSSCAHFIKYVCKYCGLVFSNKSINSHRRLHQKCNDLSIRDFTFYDLKTGKKILPSIPVFPKCGSCGKHFISKFEVKRHVCNRYNHLNCPKCDMKLSQTAYDLHMPFHDLVLSNEGIIQNLTIEANVPSASNISGKNNINAVFSCKNCILAFNSYDEAIEHCHMHRDLDEIVIEKIECKLCDLQFDKHRYDGHKKLHEDFPAAGYNYYTMDVLYFGSHNDMWLKHVFGEDCSKETVNDILENSMYRHETRVKMRLLQRGSSSVTVYKCEKCDRYVDSDGIHEHYIACDQNISTNYNDNDEYNDNPNNSIVIFNGKEDEDFNNRISNMKKCYVLYECRMCHVVVNRKCEHVCVFGDYKDCGTCGLLFNANDYDAHVDKHKRLSSFQGNYMKVILLGAKEQKFQNSKNQVSKFSGIVCDYSFYRCLNCDVCVRDYRSTLQHYCLIDAAKSKCDLCDLVFDEGKLKGHLKLHDTDPYFVKDTMFIQSFGTKKNVKNHIESIENNEISTFVSGDSVTNAKNLDYNNDSERKINIYKCKCGLHYLSEATAQVHLEKCKGKIKLKQSKQNCSKCGLQFSPDVLFKHLIEHHAKKDVTYKYEIIQVSERVDTEMES